MTKQQIDQIGYLTAAVTFLIATFILIGHYNKTDGDFIIFGLLFLPSAFLLNLIVLIYSYFKALKNAINRPLTGIYAMLLNIPYGIFCLWFSIHLLNTFRITILNDTNSTIQNLHLEGCENKYIKQLKPGQEKTYWLELNNDCSVQIQFQLLNGIKKQDVVAGYLCSGMGRKAIYHLSGKNNPKY